jgi:hypothetical protein
VTSRIRVRAELAALLEALTDEDLTRLLDRAPGKPGWGIGRTLEIGSHRVFVKSIPVTALELAHFGSTQNLFGLPVEYHYGVGSAGFGAARELAAHITTTRWVLEGRIENFPILYHHRVLPIGGQTRVLDKQQLERYVESWDRNAAIR